MNTENFTQLTMDGWDDEVYRHYDGMVATALEAIWNLSSEHKVIRLYRFDRKNKAHMCILRIALMARDLYQYPVEVDTSWWGVMCLNRQLRKNFDKVKRFRLKVGKNDNKGVNVPMMIDHFRSISKAHFGCVNFKEIYEAYYERKM